MMSLSEACTKKCNLPGCGTFCCNTRTECLIDLMAETDGRLAILFTKKRHHADTSVLYFVLFMFPKNKESRTISKTSQYMVVFKPRIMARHMYPGRVKFMQKSFKDATSVPYGYLLIDLKQETREDLRLRTTIFPDDAVRYIYLTRT
ncbi:hypothetical protein LSAT2_010069 [Lamellibrachia satsuma]|nr:hypothetical protein LSAT2_010069 [Lamellibrachia satsuma]